MAERNKLSIYLIKKEITDVSDIFENYNKIKVFKKYSDDSIAYYIDSNVHNPNWLNSFFHHNGKGLLLQANSRVVLIKRIKVQDELRFFALTFGYARFMFKDDVFEEQFGLRIILNSIQQNQIRKLSKASVGSNQKQSDEQLPKSSDISEFGFDVNRDLIKNVSGKSDDKMFESSMLTGGDIFSLTIERDINNIDDFLQFCFKRYKEKTYQQRFAWVDNIKYIKNNTLITYLNQSLIKEIKTKNYDTVWMAVPEVVQWENIKDFKISGMKETLNDIYIDKVISSLRNKLTGIEQLQTKKIFARSSLDETKNEYEWTAYKCIIAEIAIDGHQYCLSDGKWYKINNHFVDQINTQYNNIDLCNDKFVDYDSGISEDKYNDLLLSSLSKAHLLHKYKIAIGGGQGNNIEPCDLLWGNKMIHVKKNGGSSVLSHLFNQALVAGQMWLDENFREQVRSKMNKDNETDCIKEPFVSSDYEIIIAIINKFPEERPKIPFFSKVAICFTASNIKNLGYKIKLKNIKTI